MKTRVMLPVPYGHVWVKIAETRNRVLEVMFLSLCQFFKLVDLLKFLILVD